jgi:colanic acid/amylovoran biosynthesis glycosyltransferase
MSKVNVSDGVPKIVSAGTRSSAILYVASRLPALTETFVYREMLGLRSANRVVLGAGVRAAKQSFVDDPVMIHFAREVYVAYSIRTLLTLPMALASHPGVFAGAFSDTFRADHANLKERAKHLLQAVAGIGLGWRCRNKGVGHVHAHMAHVPATVALYAARTLGARFSFTGHAADLFVQRSGLRFKLEQADFVACISLWHREFYNEVLSLPPEKTPIVRCSVALPKEGSEARKEIVVVGRLIRKKGIDLLIQAFAEANLPQWRLRIIGEGPERSALERLAFQSGLGDRISIEGAKPHSYCLDAISHAGMFALPCRTALDGDRDGIPVVLMEAMAAARPVVSGDLPSIRELISDGATGILVRPDRVDDLTSAIERIAGDEGLATALGAAAREHVASEFSDEVNLARLENAFDHVRMLALAED